MSPLRLDRSLPSRLAWSQRRGTEDGTLTAARVVSSSPIRDEGCSVFAGGHPELDAVRSQSPARPVQFRLASGQDFVQGIAVFPDPLFVDRSDLDLLITLHPIDLVQHGQQRLDRPQ